MEPRFFKRGNRAAIVAEAIADYQLQWSHVFSNVEINYLRSQVAEKQQASMEPRFFKRGNTVTRRSHAGHNTASMEPRFFKRGNCRGASLSLNWTALQWSHVFSNVEIAESCAVSEIRHMLQWSHVFSNVEMRCRLRGAVYRLGASMEPRFFKRGNLLMMTSDIGSSVLASMEPRFFKRGNSYSLRGWNQIQRASMEPRFFKRGNAKDELQFASKITSFNGATFFQTWKSHKVL